MKPHPIDELTRGRFKQVNGRGRFGECLTCGLAVGCTCNSPAPAVVGDDEPDIASLVKPRGGKSVPFHVFDHTIRDFHLSSRDALVLLFLCRRTFGWGRFHGDYISAGEIAAACDCSRQAVRRSLESLEVKRLVTRVRQGMDEKSCPKTGFLGVIIPDYWPAEN